MNRALPALLLLLYPATCPGVTATDLSSRIRIDGRAIEYTDDEWILDGATVFRESDHDSRWGADNDVWRIAATWDETYLYIAIEGSIHQSALMAFLEYAGGGIPDLISYGFIRRNVDFFGILPNLVIQANRASIDASVAVVSILDPLRYLDPDQFSSRYFQPALGPGALEIALPWSLVLPKAGFVKLLASVTGGVGTGVGDAAPDPTQLLPIAREAQAHLDNAITIPVDDNHDGEPDMGVMPRSVVSFEFEQQAPAGAGGDIGLELETNSFAPDNAQILRFKIDANCSVATVYYVSCEVFSVSGKRVRVLFQNEARVLQAGADPPWDEWDGRDDSGEIVRGGMYVVLVTAGASLGEISSSAKESAAVVR